MVDLLGEGEKKTKESSLGTAMCPTMHTKTKSGGGVCDSQQAAASASFNAGARARRAATPHPFVVVCPSFPAILLLFWRLAALRSLTQCRPPATPGGLWSPSPCRETLELSGYCCVNGLTQARAPMAEADGRIGLSELLVGVPFPTAALCAWPALTRCGVG